MELKQGRDFFWKSSQIVLIVPYGIETKAGKLFFPPGLSLNRTLWN